MQPKTITMQVLHQTIRAFALQVQDSLNRREPGFFNEHFDFGGSSARMYSVLDRYHMSNRKLMRYRNLYQPGWCDLGQALIDRMEEGSAFRYLGWYQPGAQHRLVFRLLESNMYLSYFELICRVSNDKIQIRDVLDFRLGEAFGELDQMILEMELGPTGFWKRWERRLSPANAEHRLHEQFMRLKKEGEFVRAMQTWDLFSPEMKERKFYQLQKIQVCTFLRPERFLDAVEGYCNSFPMDGCFYLVALDGYRENGMYEAALDCVNRLDHFVGGDAALNFHRGRLHEWMGRKEEAASYGQLFACMEPSFDAGFELLANALAESKSERALA